MNEFVELHFSEDTVLGAFIMLPQYLFGENGLFILEENIQTGYFGRKSICTPRAWFYIYTIIF